jgi:hypothetical protein
MLSYLRFVLCAVRCGHAYIDFDGTLCRAVPVDGTHYTGPSMLDAWRQEVATQVLQGRARLIKRHVALLLLLRVLGVQLHLWTNRGVEMRWPTLGVLGPLAGLFRSMTFYDGRKGDNMPLCGPIIDDEQKYVEIAPRYIGTEALIRAAHLLVPRR